MSFSSDTPIQEESNYSCPNFPHNANSCNTSNSNGDMFMNYMDYTNDACMNLFTNGQKVRETPIFFLASSKLFCRDCIYPKSIKQINFIGIKTITFLPISTIFYKIAQCSLLLFCLIEFIFI